MALLGWLDDLRRDVPYSLRGMNRTPGVTFAVILTVALGVGATAAIFHVSNTIALRPLPYRDSDRLLQLAENVVRDTPSGRQHSRRFGLTQAEFLEWRARATTFSHLAGVINLMSGTMQTAEGTIAAPRAIVSPALFEMLGVPAQLGRTLIPDDERPDSEAAVISASAWERLFAADPGALGRQVTLNNATFTIVGVMPPGFEYPERSTMFWTALAPRPGPGTNVFGVAIARLEDGMSLTAANEEAIVLGSSLRAQQGPTGFGAAGPPPPPPSAIMGGQLRSELDLADRPRFEMIPIRDLLVDPIRPQMRVLGLAVIAVLLVVCANVANLLLARGVARRREIGVRLAIGAGRGRIIRQMITESAVLSIAGGIAGLLVAVAAVQLVKTLATVQTPRLFQLSINLGNGSLLPRIGELGVDWTLVMAALGIAVLTGIIFGVFPAAYMSRADVSAVLRAGGSRSEAAPPSVGRFRNGLVLAQVVMATMLLVGAGLLVRSFWKLQTVEAGYDARNVLTLQLVFPAQTPSERQLSNIEGVLERLQSDPRVASAGYTNIAPFLSLTEYAGLFVPPGSTREQMLDDPLRPQARIVSHEYLQTLDTRLLEGRWLEESDAATQPLVMLVNRALAQRYFSGLSPVGALVRVFRSPEYVEDWRIIGVVDDVRQARLDQDPFPIVYADMRQVLAARARMPKDLQLGQGLSGFPTIALRARTTWEPLAGEVRSMVRGVDPTLNVDAIADLESLRYGSLVRPRFYAVLVATFAAIAGGLAALGIYAVLAFFVAQRTLEIGVRMALGAHRRAVLAHVLRDGLWVTLAGIAIGLTAAAGVTRYLSTMLYGLTPLDATTYAAVAVGFLAVATLACYAPARRATTVDPAVALRGE